MSKPRHKAYVAIEDSMMAAVRAAVETRAKKLLSGVRSAIAESKFADAHKLVEQFTLEPAVAASRTKFKTLAVSAVLFGASRHKPVAETGPAKSGKVTHFVDTALNQLSNMLVHNATLRVKAAAMLLLHDAEDQAKQALQKDDQPRDEKGQFASTGGKDALGRFSDFKAIDALSLQDNKDLLQSMHAEYVSNEDYRQATDLVSVYMEDMKTSLATREIAAQVLSGKTEAQLLGDSKVQKLAQEADMSEEKIKKAAANAPGYYATLRRMPDIDQPLFRGSKAVSAEVGKTIELRGPTAFSADRNAAMTYSGGALIKVETGAKALPSRAMQASRSDNEHATVPAFWSRSESKAHPLGSGYGFSIGFDTDREVTTSGRFEVTAVEKAPVKYTDTVTGKTRTREIKLITVKHVAVF